jgi:hypothetical protein
MIRFKRPVIALCALLAAGVVTVIDLAQSRPQEASPATQVAARFPQAHERATLVQPRQVPSASARSTHISSAAAKGDKLRAAPTACVREHWPYIADECLSTTASGKTRRPIRTITIERQFAEKPAPVAQAQLASR